MTKTLAELKAEIDGLHEDFVEGVKTNLERARKIGDLLVEVKRQIRRGKFTNWVKDNCRFGPTAARHYMIVARHWGEIGTDPQLYDAPIGAAIDKVRGIDIRESNAAVARTSRSSARPETQQKWKATTTEYLERTLDCLEDSVGNLVLKHEELLPLMDDITRWRSILHKLKLVRRSA